MNCLRQIAFSKKLILCPVDSDSYIFSISNSEQSREVGILARWESTVILFFSGELSCVEKWFSYKVLRTEMCYSDIRGIR